MKKMIWHQDTMSYRGECRDGSIVEVSGDEFSESKADGINALVASRNIDREALSVEEDEALIDALEDEVLKELDDPDMWASLAGDNPNVEIVNV